MEQKRLKGITKAAIVTISLGTEHAPSVLKNLREDEVEQLTLEIAKIGNIDPNTAKNALQEFYDLCMAQKFVAEGGIEFAKNVLEKTYGIQHANNLIERILKSLKIRAFDFIKKIDSQHLMGFIQNEHPQTIALILSHVSTEQATEVIAGLPRNKQVDVIERIAMLDRTSPEIIKEVETTLERKLSSVLNNDFLQTGGVKNVAEILNTIDRSTEKYIFEELNKRDQKLAEEIRKRMFVFEDIVNLDDRAIQLVLREIDTRDLMIALKGSNSEVQEVIYANMSSRMRETIKEDMQYLRGIRYRDVEESQQKIVTTIRKLEDSGEIVIYRGGKDEIIA